MTPFERDGIRGRGAPDRSLPRARPRPGRDRPRAGRRRRSIPALRLASDRLRRDLDPRPSVVPIRGAARRPSRRGGGSASGCRPRSAPRRASSRWSTPRRGCRRLRSVSPLTTRRTSDARSPAAADRRRAHVGRALAGRRRVRRLALDAARARVRSPMVRAARAVRVARAAQRRHRPEVSTDADQAAVVPAPARRLPARSLDEVPLVRGDAVQQAARQGPARLPVVRPPLPAVGRRSARALSSTTARSSSGTPGLQSVDPLGFVDQKAYPDRIAAAQLATGMRDAAVWGTGTIDGRPVAICVMDFGFMGGSMGAVVGEKVTRAAEHALDPAPAAHRRLGVRRGADAGGNAGPDAAREDRSRRSSGCGPPACRSSASCPTRRPAASSPRSRSSATSTSPSRTRSSASPARGSRPGRSPRSCRPGFQRSEFLFEHGFLDRVVHRSELRSELSVPPRLPRAGRRRERHADDAGAARAAVVPAAVVPVEPRRAGHAERAVSRRRRPTAPATRDRRRRRRPSPPRRPPRPPEPSRARGRARACRGRRSPDAPIRRRRRDDPPTEAPRG